MTKGMHGHAAREKVSTMNDLAAYVANWREGKGFKTPGTILDHDGVLAKLMLVTTELAEAAEAVRHGDNQNFEEELADTFIRLLDITGTMGIDIDKAIRDKMAINEGRPRLHGKVC